MVVIIEIVCEEVVRVMQTLADLNNCYAYLFGNIVKCDKITFEDRGLMSDRLMTFSFLSEHWK